MTAARSLFDAQKVMEAIQTLHETGTVFELRALNVKLKQNFRTYKAISGFFNSPESLTKELGRIDQATGIYVTLNPVDPALLNRAINRLNEDATANFAVKDKDITRRRWLLIDLDPVRPQGVSATEEELSKAKNKAKQIHAFLKDQGWSPPVCALSGNGIHLLYRVDLPADDGELLKRVLLTLSQMFDGDGVDVDKSVHNPSRITKLYGTLASKGDNSDERPHRMSNIVQVPKQVGVVTKEQLEQIAAIDADADTAKRGRNTPSAMTVARATAMPARRMKDWDAHAFADEFILRHGIQVARVENKGGDTYHMLEVCPWANEHGGADKPGDAAIIVQANGSLGFKCFHSHCADRHWRDLRLLFEPDCENNRQSKTRQYGGRFADAGSEDDPESADLKAAFFEILWREGLKSNERHAEMAKATVAALHRRGRFFYHADRKDFASTMYFDGRRKLLLLVASDEFQAWLSGYTGLNLSETAFDYVASACKQEALAGDTTGIVPAAYWHGTPNAVYLSNGDGRMAKITAGKAEEVDNGTDDVLFAAGQTLKPWKPGPPVDPFVACSVFSDAAASPEGLELLRLWAVSLPTGQRCKPPLVLTGTVGSGKTKVACSVFELFGITPRVVLLADHGEEDFWTQLDGGGLVCFDNADTKIRWLADALQVAATDGSHEKRMLYTDGTIIRQHAKAWVVLTSANPTFASDAGLADRLLVTRFERRNRETAEASLSDEVAEARDGGLSWIAGIIAKALADKSPVEGGNLNRRHPDFASFSVRLGRAMGREKQAVAALRSAENDKSRFNLENDEVGSALLELGEWQGTAAELLEAIIAMDSSFEGKWSAKRLGKRLAKLWPHLESVLHASKEAEGHSKQVVYRFNSPPAGFAEYQKAIPEKSYISSSQGDFPENASPNPANPATSSPVSACPSPPSPFSYPRPTETVQHAPAKTNGKNLEAPQTAFCEGMSFTDSMGVVCPFDDNFLLDPDDGEGTCQAEGRTVASTTYTDEPIKFEREDYSNVLNYVADNNETEEAIRCLPTP
jgi:hypothetical protein